MSKLIVIEGNMAIGKSTMAKNLGELLNYHVLDEPVDSNPYLEKFYIEPKRYAFEMQLWIMMRRYQMHRDAYLHIAETGQPVLMDRSIYGDAIFAKVNYQEQNIGENSYETYLQIKKTLISTIRVPDVVIYLDSSVDKIYERLRKRSRSCEILIPRSYVEKLQKVYKQWLESLYMEPQSLVQVFDHSDFVNPSDIINLMNFEVFKNS